MSEVFQQFAFINALFCAVTITYMSFIYFSKPSQLLADITVTMSLVACVMFMLATMALTLLAAKYTLSKPEEFTHDSRQVYQISQHLFAGGVGLTFIALGLGGFLRSKEFGKITVTTSVLAVIIYLYIIRMLS